MKFLTYDEMKAMVEAKRAERLSAETERLRRWNPVLELEYFAQGSTFFAKSETIQRLRAWGRKQCKQ